MTTPKEIPEPGIKFRVRSMHRQVNVDAF